MCDGARQKRRGSSFQGWAGLLSGYIMIYPKGNINFSQEWKPRLGNPRIQLSSDVDLLYDLGQVTFLPWAQCSYLYNGYFRARMSPSKLALWCIPLEIAWCTKPWERTPNGREVPSSVNQTCLLLLWVELLPAQRFGRDEVELLLYLSLSSLLSWCHGLWLVCRWPSL